MKVKRSRSRSRNKMKVRMKMRMRRKVKVMHDRSNWNNEHIAKTDEGKKYNILIISQGYIKTRVS